MWEQAQTWYLMVARKRQARVERVAEGWRYEVYGAGSTQNGASGIKATREEAQQAAEAVIAYRQG